MKKLKDMILNNQQKNVNKSLLKIILILKKKKIINDNKIKINKLKL